MLGEAGAALSRIGGAEIADSFVSTAFISNFLVNWVRSETLVALSAPAAPLKRTLRKHFGATGRRRGAVWVWLGLLWGSRVLRVGRGTGS